MESVFIVSAVRTPIGKFGGGLASLSAADMGTAAATEAITRAKIFPDLIDETIFGCARQAGGGPNVGRQISHRAGVPDEKPAYTINQACASSLRAVVSGYQSILLNEANVVLVGGTESMSNVPYFLPKARWGYRLGSAELVDGMYKDGFLCPLCGKVMGETAETLAEQYKISRREQDEYAVMSQNRAEQAWGRCDFRDEVVPIEAAGMKIEKDEHFRSGVTVESLVKLKPVFKADGTVHAGNSSGITDGAAALILASESAVKDQRLEPLARIIDFTSVGVDPAIMGIGPVSAVKKLFARTKLKLDDIDLIELNEAFAAQVIACERELHFDRARLNVNGGAIALGHPIGATGARILTTLVFAMKKRNAKRGIATLCVSGG
ncbi:MAG TPA: thiolase family protein, partial [candidate division Zixibacteria bacterium]|nr:thiolase family protein [candidate division Zixibacteria bacterium]